MKPKEDMRAALEEAAGILAGLADTMPKGLELRKFLRERVKAYRRIAAVKP